MLYLLQDILQLMLYCRILSQNLGTNFCRNHHPLHQILVTKKKPGKGGRMTSNKPGKGATHLFWMIISNISNWLYPTRICNGCKVVDLEICGIRCMDCRKHLCNSCDVKIHQKSPFHRRLLIKKDYNENLPACEFFNSNWERFVMGNFKFVFKWTCNIWT